MNANKNILISVIIILLISSVGYGATSWTGNLSGSSLSYGGNWSNAVLSWYVDLVGSTYQYKYTLSVANTSPGISHWIIECSNNFSAPNSWEKATYSNKKGNSNPGLTTPIYGFKVNSRPSGSSDMLWTISFTSDHAPVWGDFYAKGGSNSYVYNKAIDTAFDPNAYIWLTNNSASKIAVPDSKSVIAPPDVTPVPEPSTLVGFLTGTGLFGILYLKKRKSF